LTQLRVDRQRLLHFVCQQVRLFQVLGLQLVVFQSDQQIARLHGLAASDKQLHNVAVISGLITASSGTTPLAPTD
jgi:hypothetical protein